VNKKKPVNLQLTTIKFPLTAIVSILHRISGFALFLAVPLVLVMLQSSLASPEAFFELQVCLSHPFVKLITFGIIAGLLYHLVAGIRHLLMDAGIGESKCGGRVGAGLVVVISIVLILIAGVLLWL
jgi:succinate dehydrogenase / fumarate reductase, cytochrome b subunit